VRRFCAAMAMPIAMMMAAAGCIPIESPPLQFAADPAAPPGPVTCEGLFAKDTDHDKLLAAFGASNVAFEETHTGVEDITEMATVLYPQDPARRLKIFWQYREERKFPMEILIDDKESQWTAGNGLRLALNLQQVEALNKRPFRVSGFDTDFFGMVSFRGGALEHVRGGCVQGVRFAPDADNRTPNGDILLSNDPKLRSLDLKVIQIFVHYPKVQ
jgi:hypothetical protein